MMNERVRVRGHGEEEEEYPSPETVVQVWCVRGLDDGTFDV
jgi:hypothetical protein